MTVAVTSVMPIPLDPVSAEVAIGTPTGGVDANSGFAMLVAAMSDGGRAGDIASDASIGDDASTGITATATINEMPPMAGVAQVQWLAQLQATNMGIFTLPQTPSSPLPQADAPFDPATGNAPADAAAVSAPTAVTVSSLSVPPPANAPSVAVATVTETVGQAEVTNPFAELADEADQPAASPPVTANTAASMPAPAVGFAPVMKAQSVPRSVAPDATPMPPETAEVSAAEAQSPVPRTKTQMAGPATAPDDTASAVDLAPANDGTATSTPVQEKPAPPQPKLASNAQAQPAKAQTKPAANEPEIAVPTQAVPVVQANLPQTIMAPEAAAVSLPEMGDAASEADDNSSSATQPIPVPAIPFAGAEPRPATSATPAPAKSATAGDTDGSTPAQSDAGTNQSNLTATMPAPPAAQIPPVILTPGSPGLDALESAPPSVMASAAKPNWAPANLASKTTGGFTPNPTATDAAKTNTQDANTAQAGTQPANPPAPNTTAPVARTASAESQSAPQSVNAAPSPDSQQTAQHAAAHSQHIADTAPAAPPQQSSIANIASDSATMTNAITFNPPSPADAPVRIGLTAGSNGGTVADMDALALKIAARNADGDSNFQIRLDPPELGRIDVVLNVDSHGKAAAQLSADNPRTLELLQKDAPALERALKESGIDLGSMSFSLKSDAQASQEREARNSARDRNIRIGAIDAAAASAAMIGSAGLSGQNFGAGTMRLDITV